MTYKQIKSVPEAYITRTQTQSRGRYKIFDNNVYIKNDQEFEIELFNPTDRVVMATLSFNGDSDSGTGLVLKPGQRVYLDRYLNEAVKFKFETYTVGKSDEVAQAIKQNGSLTIRFFNEAIKPAYIRGNPYYGSNNVTWENLNYSGSKGFGAVNDGTGGYVNLRGSSNTTIGTTVTDNTFLSYTNGNTAQFNVKNSTPTSSLNCSLNEFFEESAKQSEAEVETGRIEKGAQSKQEFVFSNYNFEHFSWHEVKYNLMPESTKPIEVKDLTKFCTNCGTKAKKEHNFCSKCGIKL